MTIRCKCDHCGASLKVKDELAGKTKRCPQCQETIRIPGNREEPQESNRVGAKRGGSGEEEDFPYFDDVPVKPIRSGNSGSFSSPLSGGEEPFDPYAPPPKGENKIKGSAAGIAGELLRKIETTDRKSRGSGAKNKKNRKIFGDIDDKLSTSEQSVSESFSVMLRGFLLPALGLSALVGLAYFTANYLMGPDLKLPPLGKVSGKIQINGKPIPNARIEFHPLEAETGEKNLGTSMGVSDGNGNFTIYYIQGIPGAVVGKHKVQLFAQDATGRELIPPQYNANTTEVLEVKSGSNKMDFLVESQDDPSAGAGGDQGGVEQGGAVPGDGSAPVNPAAPAQ